MAISPGQVLALIFAMTSQYRSWGGGGGGVTICNPSEVGMAMWLNCVSASNLLIYILSKLVLLCESSQVGKPYIHRCNFILHLWLFRHYYILYHYAD